MSECQQFEELIGAYSDGELTGAEACRVADHLSNCPRCRQELKAIEELRDRLTLARDEFKISLPGFAESVMKKIQGEKLPAFRSGRVLDFFRPRRFYFRPAYIALAAAGLMIVVSFGSFLWWKTSSGNLNLARSQETRFTETELANSPELYLYQHSNQIQMNAILPVQTADFTFVEGD
ncbi:MAG: zf-HC2 domain-containing protein [Proteobacteria bacterium]|nr:zf-HC2 domain-containing protein [Pseudomonadota bacterium]